MARQLKAAGLSFEYETDKIRYTVPARTSLYTPDFKLIKLNGEPMYIESKGLFETKDRKKHLLLRDQFPDLDIRLLFQRASNRISNTSSTTYAKWADSKGITWAECGRDGKIPEAWLAECRD